MVEGWCQLGICGTSSLEGPGPHLQGFYQKSRPIRKSGEFKIWTVLKLDVFLPGRWTFNTFKNRKIIQTFFFQTFFQFCFFKISFLFVSFDTKVVIYEN